MPWRTPLMVCFFLLLRGRRPWLLQLLRLDAPNSSSDLELLQRSALAESSSSRRAVTSWIFITVFMIRRRWTICKHLQTPANTCTHLGTPIIAHCRCHCNGICSLLNRATPWASSGILTQTSTVTCCYVTGFWAWLGWQQAHSSL